MIAGLKCEFQYAIIMFLNQVCDNPASLKILGRDGSNVVCNKLMPITIR